LLKKQDSRVVTRMLSLAALSERFLPLIGAMQTVVSSSESPFRPPLGAPSGITGEGVSREPRDRPMPAVGKA